MLYIRPLHLLDLQSGGERRIGWNNDAISLVLDSSSVGIFRFLEAIATAQHKENDKQQ